MNVATLVLIAATFAGINYVGNAAVKGVQKVDKTVVHVVKGTGSKIGGAFKKVF